MLGELPAGSRFGGYTIVRVLGQGAMGVVYEATDERLKRRVALKVIAPDLARDPSFRARFDREAQLASNLDHEAIITIHHADEVEGQPFIAMRLIEGVDLQRLIEERGACTLDQVIAILRPIAGALDFAHAAGLVHRDVKPANIILTEPGTGPGRSYLMDFGITREVHGANLTGTGALLGTPNFMAPEQVNNARVEAAADQYALGCVAYALLSGSPPFERDTMVAVLLAHLRDEAPSLQQVAGLPVEVDTVLGRAMAKEPADRYPSCAAFIDALGVIGSGSASVGSAPVTPAEPDRTPIAVAPEPPPAGTVVEAPLTVLEAPESVVEAPETVVEAPESVVEAPETVVEAPGTVVETPGTVVEAPGTVVEAPGTVVEAPGTVVEAPGTVVEAPARPPAETTGGTRVEPAPTRSAGSRRLPVIGISLTAVAGVAAAVVLLSGGDGGPTATVPTGANSTATTPTSAATTATPTATTPPSSTVAVSDPAVSDNPKDDWAPDTPKDLVAFAQEPQDAAVRYRWPARNETVRVVYRRDVTTVDVRYAPGAQPSRAWVRFEGGRLTDACVFSAGERRCGTSPAALGVGTGDVDDLAGFDRAYASGLPKRKVLDPLAEDGALEDIKNDPRTNYPWLCAAAGDLRLCVQENGLLTEMRFGKERVVATAIDLAPTAADVRRPR